jgi:hypothetical protein
MIWPTYSASAITVTLYSTKHVEVAQTGQSKRPQGSCTVVTTQRTRTYADGKTKTDTVRARYRAGEGIDCSESVPPPSTTTTTLPGAPPPPPAPAPTTTASP